MENGRKKVATSLFSPNSLLFDLSQYADFWKVPKLSGPQLIKCAGLITSHVVHQTKLNSLKKKINQAHKFLASPSPTPPDKKKITNNLYDSCQQFKHSGNSCH